MSITLYDIWSTAPGRSISPNTFKARVALTFKGLTFKTEWLQLPDIEPRLKEIGAEPTSTGKDGSPPYTVPVIHDHSTGRIVSDSMRIARYLDETYPDRPALFPHGVYAPIEMFDAYFFPTAILPGIELIIYGTMERTSPRCAEHMRRTRDKAFMARVAELAPPNPKRGPLLAAAKDGFSKVARILSANGGESPFFYGNTLSYADIIVVAYLLWIRASLGVESHECKEIEEWDNGRWVKLLSSTEKYHGLENE